MAVSSLAGRELKTLELAYYAGLARRELPLISGYRRERCNRPTCRTTTSSASAPTFLRTRVVTHWGSAAGSEGVIDLDLRLNARLGAPALGKVSAPFVTLGDGSFDEMRPGVIRTVAGCSEESDPAQR